MKKNKNLFIILISIVLAIGVLATILLFLKNDKPKSYDVNNLELLAPLIESNPEEATEMVMKNTVKIINKIDDENTIYGTGFFDKSGYLITNSHVVDIKGKIEVMYNDGSKTNAYLESNDIVSDIAILSVEDVKVKALSFKSTIDLGLAADLYSVGYQLNLEGDASITKGILSARRSSTGIEFLQTDAAVNEGGSGGPLITDKGELVGMISLASDNATLSFAISSDTLELYINKLINDKEVTYIESERLTNALSNVLIEVGYKDIADIYNEHKYYNKKDDKKEPDYNNNNFDNNFNNNQNYNPVDTLPPVEDKIDYNIVPYYIAPILLGTNIPVDNPSQYFEIDSRLTGCKIDTSEVNIYAAGTYNLNLVCNESSSSTRITVFANDNISYMPIMVLGKEASNVYSYDAISGTWYYPGYNDVCTVYYENPDSYCYMNIKVTPYGRLSYAEGGGGCLFKNEFFNNEYNTIYLYDNYLIVSYDSYQTPFILTRSIGNNSYGNSVSDECNPSYYR